MIGRGWRASSRAQKIMGAVVILLLLVLISAAAKKAPPAKTVSSPASPALTTTVTSTQAAQRPPHVRTRTVTSTATVSKTVTRTVSASGSGAPSAPAVVAEGPGSTTHAGDAQFCSTHSCIPSFPTATARWCSVSMASGVIRVVCLAPAQTTAAKARSRLTHPSGAFVSLLC